MTRNIDELSNLQTRSVEPEKYFGEMDLDEEQVEKRIKYTKKANELFDIILILLLTMRDNGEVDYSYARTLLETWLLSLIAEFTTPDDYLIDYASDTAFNFVDTTQKNIDKEWYTSSDRALFNAENSANDVLNYSEYEQAIKEGKTHKQWITESDNRVRDSHKDVEKKPIPIKEYFRVGMAKMRFPKDYEYAAAFPEELVNCRCSIRYLPEDKDSLTRKKEYYDEKQHYISDKRFDNLTWEARKTGAEIRRDDPEGNLLLDANNASAMTLGDILYFRKNVTVSDVLEETYHYKQFLRDSKLDIKDAYLNSLKNEIEAKEYLLKNAKKYAIPRIETEETRKHLAEYEKQYERALYERGYTGV